MEGATVKFFFAWKLKLAAALIAAVAFLMVIAMSSIVGSSYQQANAAPSGPGGGVSDSVPEKYRSDVIRAGSICAGITPALIAAQIAAESNWDENAGSHAGAQGISQFMPATWDGGAGKDGDGDGKADIHNPHDAIISQGHYMCSMLATVKSYIESGTASGAPVELALAAYNAGAGAVQSAGGIPTNGETEKYVPKIINAMPTYQGATTLTTNTTAVSATTAQAIEWAKGIANDDSHTYVWGGEGPHYDCSGLTQAFMRQLGIELPHQASQQATYGQQVTEAEAVPGDLIFWSMGGGEIDHVAIYIGDGQMVSADSPDMGINVEAIYGRNKSMQFRHYQ